MMNGPDGRWQAFAGGSYEPAPGAVVTVLQSGITAPFVILPGGSLLRAAVFGGAGSG